jgi:hypothetical protein
LVVTDQRSNTNVGRQTRLSAKRAGTRSARSFAKTALRYDAVMRDHFCVTAISPSLRLLMTMIGQESMSIKEAMLSVPLSYRAFYTMLAILKSKDRVRVVTDANDRRVKRLILGPEFTRLQLEV